MYTIRRFILIQRPEKTYTIEQGVHKATKEGRVAFSKGFNTIADIGRERLKLSGQDVIQQKTHPLWKKDIGFRSVSIVDLHRE